ncbi:hypothetical protein BT69DRAFT_274820 [Atractiella rhizophila]|nr:hypothetical protein BT69DRAFT_274820 [Atractiella rhizophila]
MLRSASKLDDGAGMDFVVPETPVDGLSGEEGRREVGRKMKSFVVPETPVEERRRQPVEAEAMEMGEGEEDSSPVRVKRKKPPVPGPTTPATRSLRSAAKSTTPKARGSSAICKDAPTTETNGSPTSKPPASRTVRRSSSPPPNGPRKKFEIIIPPPSGTNPKIRLFVESSGSVNRPQKRLPAEAMSASSSLTSLSSLEPDKNQEPGETAAEKAREFARKTLEMVKHDVEIEDGGGTGGEDKGESESEEELLDLDALLKKESKKQDTGRKKIVLEESTLKTPIAKGRENGWNDQNDTSSIPPAVSTPPTSPSVLNIHRDELKKLASEFGQKQELVKILEKDYGDGAAQSEMEVAMKKRTFWKPMRGRENAEEVSAWLLV